MTYRLLKELSGFHTWKKSDDLPEDPSSADDPPHDDHVEAGPPEEDEKVVAELVASEARSHDDEGGCVERRLLDEGMRGRWCVEGR